MIINNDSPDTADRNVAIYVHGAWNEMRLRNDSGAWGEWQPFSSSFTWTINDGVGEHMNLAELRSGSDTHSSCDKINLTTATAVAARQRQLPTLSASFGVRRPARTGAGRLRLMLLNSAWRLSDGEIVMLQVKLQVENVDTPR